jgi:hypothetical protein
MGNAVTTSPDTCSQLGPLGKCGATTTALFRMGRLVTMPRCIEHAGEMRKTLQRIVKAGQWSEEAPPSLKI